MASTRSLQDDLAADLHMVMVPGLPVMYCRHYAAELIRLGWHKLPQVPEPTTGEQARVK